MREGFSGSMITVTMAGAAVGVAISVSITSAFMLSEIGSVSVNPLPDLKLSRIGSLRWLHYQTD